MIFGLFLLLTILSAQSSWIETTQEDFADGIYEHNIYSSCRDSGTIEFAPRFDLNNDEYLEIVTCAIGGNVTLYWGSATGYNPGNTVVFPGSGAGNIDIADVNCDGYSDFIVTHANSDSRLAIYWGSSSGPSPGNVFSIWNSTS
ncbi:VCBS repeat-containing protein, partial [candidate division WOR-3 bacterium]|nr:VCBS repeat-containing protein [candidate division WOR-3 bacterium]